MSFTLVSSKHIEPVKYIVVGPGVATSENYYKENSLLYHSLVVIPKSTRIISITAQSIV